MRIASLGFDSLVNGSGLRRVVFFQGCSLHCKGCFNKHTWSFNEGKEISIDELIKDIENTTINKKLTLSRGNPLEQKEILTFLIKLKEKNYNIWCYTGYTYEYCLKHFREELNYIDVLVDGKFMKQYKGYYRYKGSSNQRIIDVQKSLKNNKIEVMQYE